MKGPIQSMELTYFIHETEDPGKVRDAVSRLLPSPPDIDYEKLSGHFGNMILRGRVHLAGDEATAAFGRVVAALPRSLKQQVAADLRSFLDEHSSFYLRLDKQALVSGSLSLGSGDPIRLKVKPRLYLVKGSAPRFFLELLGR